jgi:hypothetical protein
MNVSLERVMVKVKAGGFKDEDIFHFVSKEEADNYRVKPDEKAK